MNLADARAALVKSMTEIGALSSPHWKSAFETVPREVFVSGFTVNDGTTLSEFEPGDDGYAEAVYTDTSLITQRDTAGTATSSSSQPSLMARMLEAFSANGPVLEIGTGTGYNTALLCQRYGSGAVVSVDVDPELTDRAREKLNLAGYKPVVIAGDGVEGYPEGAPYGGILATCGVDRVPFEWLRQVRPGGVIVTNIGNAIARLTVTEDHGATGDFHPEASSFMRARPVVDYVAERAGMYSSTVINGEAESTRTAEIRDCPDGLHAFLYDLTLSSALEVSLLQHDVLSMMLSQPDETRVYVLVHPPTGSWARITVAGDHLVEVDSAGPHDLWEDRFALVGSWNRAGRPTPDRYEITVTHDGEHRLTRGSESWLCR